jgi:hypothetical protein
MIVNKILIMIIKIKIKMVVKIFMTMKIRIIHYIIHILINKKYVHNKHSITVAKILFIKIKIKCQMKILNLFNL